MIVGCSHFRAQGYFTDGGTELFTREGVNTLEAVSVLFYIKDSDEKCPGFKEHTKHRV